MRIRLKSRKGFTLIEALAAFAILTISLGQLFNGVSGGVRNEARADFLLRASRQGRSQIDALGIDEPALSGETRGQYRDGLNWLLSVTPLPVVPNSTGVPMITSFHVRLVISKPSGFGESLTLSTVKIKVDQPKSSQ